MKFFNLKYFIYVLIATIFLFSSVTSLTKQESVMDFLNDMLLKSENFEEDSFLEKATNNAPAPSKPEAAKKSEPINSNMEGWLKIHSGEFKNIVKFPALVIGGKKFKVKSNSEGFRINESADPKANTDAKLEFYFRTIKNLMYYSINKNDINVIGSFNIVFLKDSGFIISNPKSEDLCFTVTDSDSSVWDLCASTPALKNNWVCKINLALGVVKSEKECNKDSADEKPAVPEKAVDKKPEEKKEDKKKTEKEQEYDVIQPYIVIPVPAKECNQDWTYAKTGKDWECGCSEGSSQSPIDIPKKSNIVDSPISPIFKFVHVAAKSPITTIDGELKSNEYIKMKYFKNAVRILHSNLGKIVTLDGSVYIGEEMIFHTPSEHTINGKRFDMELQIIFYGRSKGDIAKQVVLSFLFEKKAGVFNKFIDDIDFFSLPSASNPEKDILHEIFIPKLFYRSSDDSEVKMKNFSFYTYQGSLTAPPCSEQTIHYVVADPIPLASVPIDLFKEAIKGSEKLSGNFAVDTPVDNYRETQPLNGRPVFFYDSKKYGEKEVVEKKIKKTAKARKPDGHYERIKKTVTDYFYVNGKDPSGVAGSLVVSDEQGKN